MQRYEHRSSLEQMLTEEALGMFILVGIAFVYVTAKAAELVIRVLVAHPGSRPMWTALGLFVLGVGLAALMQWRSDVLNVFAVVATAALLVTAKAVEIYHEQLFLAEVDRESLATDVLQPWWGEPA